MTDHKVVSQQEWQALRADLLQREKEHTRAGDELARQRQELPWVAVEKDYRFATDDGPRPLSGLFDGRSQLLIYHFMFGPSYQAGCPVNSSMADGLDGLLPHLHARDVTLLLVSSAPLAKLQAYKRRMGWMSAFALADGAVYQTYTTTWRGVEFLMPYYPILDRAPKGRDEGDAWQLWIRRHDEYDLGDVGAGG
jgi:predicted dithiol-disulfide oxidoreductase (DUF899 family)